MAAVAAAIRPKSLSGAGEGESAWDFCFGTVGSQDDMGWTPPIHACGPRARVLADRQREGPMAMWLHKGMTQGADGMPIH